jgi:putative transport protein
MEWLTNLFSSGSVAQAVIILSLTITAGILLSKVKIAGISLGVTWILFAGITISHFGFGIDSHILHFVKEFGLILFVYSIGMQVGQGFFSSFKKGGVKLNIIASSVVFGGVAVALAIKALTGISVSATAGILSGAVTNTPGLGAAQQTYMDLHGSADPVIALGYAVAYPLGVVGIIISLILLKWIFRIDIGRENVKLSEASKDDPGETVKIALYTENPSIEGKRIKEIKDLIEKEFVISRIKKKNGDIRIAGADTIIEKESSLLIILQKRDLPSVSAFFGREIPFSEEEWNTPDKNVVSRRILVTKESVNGKSLSELKLGRAFSITVTRVNRAGVDLVATPGLKLQIGDKLTVVGTPEGVESSSAILGNALKRLREPNLIALFFGIALGILLGSIPFAIPGVPQPVKLGLAGGPLIVALLMSKFGPRFRIVTYSTISANLMIREIGIALFLACVGLDAGNGFIDIIVNGGGAIWIVYGAMITMLPLLVIGFISYKYLKINYFTLMGLMAGSCTDPPALAFANTSAKNDLPAVGYATVYPLTMFLRVLTAQLLILFA